MKISINDKIEIPEGIEVKIVDHIISVKGPKGEINRRLVNPKITITVEGKEVVLTSKNATKREKTMFGTFKAHIKHMIKGALEGYIYKLKICSTHFPMTAEVKDNKFLVKNFLGENTPRIIKLKAGVNIKIEGNEITIESPDKELAGQTAASIEQSCKITNRDRRIFQDGIYMITKAGKDL